MTINRFRVRRGQGVRVEIPHEPVKSPTDPDAAGLQPQLPRAVIFQDDRKDLYTRRGPLEIQLYDLGMRLQSLPGQPTSDPKAFIAKNDNSAAEPLPVGWNRYAPMQYEFIGDDHHTARFIFYTMDKAEILDLDQRLIRTDGALDPFDFSPANGSGRKLPNVLQLPYFFGKGDPSKSGFQAENLLQVKLGEYEGRVGKPEADPEKADWKRRKGEAGDGDEKWDPAQLAADMIFHPGSLKSQKIKAAGRLAVLPPSKDPEIFAARWPPYYFFDTGDPAFKVTKEPSYGAEAVAFRATAGKPLRIFLKPILTINTIGLVVRTSDGDEMTIGDFQTNQQLWFAGRIPIFPRLENTKETRIPPSRIMGAYISRIPFITNRLAEARGWGEYQLQQSRPNASIPPQQVKRAVGFTRYPDDPNPLDPTISPLFDRTGTLAAVVMSGEKKFYIWFATAKAFPNVAAYRPLMYDDQQGFAIRIDTEGFGLLI